jgi:hypothetical protein
MIQELTAVRDRRHSKRSTKSSEYEVNDGLHHIQRPNADFPF